MTQTIFITGASGYIGSRLTKFAISKDYIVHALSRSESSDAKLRALGAVPIRGDLSSHTILTQAAANADMVINLADALAGNFGNITMEERFKVNHAAIAALAKGLEGSNKPLVVTSGSLYAAADPNGDETNEESPGWSDPPFGVGSESVALGLSKKGIRVCIVRLAPWVYGRGGSGVKLFMQGAAQAGEFTYISPGSARTTTIHVDDAARLLLLVAEKGRAGEIYNGTSETDVTFRQLVEAMGKVMGVPVRSQNYEEAEAKMGAFFANFLSLENRASNAKAKSEFRWTVQADTGILDEIESGSYAELAKELRKSKA